MKKFAILLSLGTLALMSITAKAEVSELRVPLGAVRRISSRLARRHSSSCGIAPKAALKSKASLQ